MATVAEQAAEINTLIADARYALAQADKTWNPDDKANLYAAATARATLAHTLIAHANITTSV